MIKEGEIDASVKPSDTAIYPGQKPDLPKDTKSLDVSLIQSHDELPSAGHRRGRRKVMKKRMLKDEEGYLGQRCQRRMKPRIQILIQVSSYEGRTIMGIFFRGRVFGSKGYKYNFYYDFDKQRQKNGHHTVRTRKHQIFFRSNIKSIQCIFSKNVRFEIAMT